MAYVSCIRDAGDDLVTEASDLEARVASVETERESRPVNLGPVPIRMSKMPFYFAGLVNHRRNGLECLGT